MVLIISYNRICESIRRFEKIVNKKYEYDYKSESESESEYKDISTISEKLKPNSCLEIFRSW